MPIRMCTKCLKRMITLNEDKVYVCSACTPVKADESVTDKDYVAMLHDIPEPPLTATEALNRYERGMEALNISTPLPIAPEFYGNAVKETLKKIVIEPKGIFTPDADPNGKNQHEPGAKLDAGKTRIGLMMSDFPKALNAVAEVSTYGAAKYTDHGWRTVPDGHNRYTDAMYRHLNLEAQHSPYDNESGLLHAAHAAWGALARLEFLLREVMPEGDDDECN